MRRDPRDFALLAYDELCTFEFGSMVELFGIPRPEYSDWYRFSVAGVQRGPLRASGGITVDVAYTLAKLDRAGTIAIPGWRTHVPVPAALQRKLCRAVEEGARILAVCSGAFALAEAGLLDGLRAATHWQYAEELAERYPRVNVDPDVLFVDEGQIITSAGSAAGLDAGLHLIRRDFGGTIANEVARRLVVPPQRDGGQRQFVESPVAPEPGASNLAGVLDAIRQRLKADHSVESMAKRARMSPRTFARRFRDATGTSPHRWLIRERVLLAQRLLESSGRSIDDVAHQVGFSDAQTLRSHFKKQVGVAPTEYRRAFKG
ncbi:MAG: transcriptional regulator FtrA [Planctomycetota bacterium]